ncbi:AgmX/PglI C-terminal domain-containing protein [Fluviispira multicolorata]|uniref:AgmX/PglI C-terminal domain-containing protein n=1 Tax=Fluviispira multicolorata TaxID=2654512 RepID=A0A833N5R7_9BACT|nr:AgmX/PglI C-terminal domain-containing protein [Fluviispira multicolorata]KAB8031042.1 AgmX/PglI C-terminal domain-containing protein [Fluviispira multicolorata]
MAGNYFKGMKRKKILSENAYLHLTVFQMGAIQVEKKLKISSLFTKKVNIGSKPTCDIFIPYARALLEMCIFKIGRSYVDIILDPRFDGFLNSGNKFGELKEFTSPRGSLAKLTSIEDPLIVSLEYGSRGTVRYSGFDIAFKIEKEQIPKKFPHLKGAENNPFALPPYDVSIERNVIPISLLATGLAFLPILFWLLKAPMKPETGLINLPQEVSLGFIAPDNLRLLPFVFKTQYSEENSAKLAVFWIRELQKRWEYAETGKEYQSVIPFLQDAHKYIDFDTPYEIWEKKIFENYKKIDTSTPFFTFERYFKYLKPYPAFFTTISGDEGESQFVTLIKRINQLKRTDAAIVEYLTSEHEILKEYYAKEFNAKKVGIVEPPSTGQVIGRQPAKSFYTEFQQYKDAERNASIAEKSEFRKSFSRDIEKNKDILEKQSSSLSTPVIWITNTNLIIPANMKRIYDNENKETEFANMWHNALYSTGVYKIPDEPPPKATIDIKMVEFSIFNKKEELRSCYNTVLRKNPVLQGNLILRWRILESGKAANIVVLNSSIKDQNLITCIESRISFWNFPKPKNGSVVVTYPFQFIVTQKK